MAISRDELLLKLRSLNIGASIHYSLLHKMPLYNRGGGFSLPVTEDIANRIMTLPISASMTEEDAEYVCQQIEKILI